MEIALGIPTCFVETFQALSLRRFGVTGHTLAMVGITTGLTYAGRVGNTIFGNCAFEIN